MTAWMKEKMQTWRIMSPKSPSSTTATATVTCTTVHPAVTNGLPKTRVPSCPCVLIPESSNCASLCLSAKSCEECRERKKAITNKTAPRMTKRSPTSRKVCGSQLQKYEIWWNNRGWRSGIYSRKVKATYESGIAHRMRRETLQRTHASRKIEWWGTHLDGKIGQAVVKSLNHNLKIREQYDCKHHERCAASLSILRVHWDLQLQMIVDDVPCVMVVCKR